MDRILTNGRKLLTSNNNKLLLSRERTTGQRSGLKLDGSTNKITIPAQTLTDFTFATWFNKSASKVSSFLSNSGTNVLGLNASNQLTFNGLTASISYSIHKTWNYLVVTREAGVVKASLNKAAFVTIGTDSTSITVNELGNLFDGRMEAPALFNIANGAHKPHNYLESTIPNLIEQWKLNEGTGTTVYGIKGNNGTITGTATWTTPSLMNWVGKHCVFSGSKLVRVANNINVQVPKRFSLEFYLKFTSLPPSWSNIILKGVDNDNMEFCIRANATSDLLQFFSSGSVGLGWGLPLAANFPLNTWVHLAITKDSVTNTMLMYRNGIQVKSMTNATFVKESPVTTSDVILGTTVNSIDIQVDEVRLWKDLIRTQTQIQENMAKTLGREPGLVLNLGFESDYYDASGYGNHGTPVGSPVLEVTDNDKLLLNAPIN